jgi:hypothetical protein
VRFVRYDHKARGDNAGDRGDRDHEAQGERRWCLILS